MAYNYDINATIKDKKSMVNLTLCHILFNIVNLFTSTFLVAHIYSLTDGIYSYIQHVALYELSAYIVMLLALHFASKLVDKTNRIGVYIASNIVHTALVILFVFNGKEIAGMVVLAGALRGIAHGLYYASYNVLKQEMVSRKTIKSYANIIQILKKIVSVVFPIIIGALIDASSFSMVAIYILIIAVIQLIFSCFVKSKKPEGSKFDLKDYYKHLKENKELYNRIKAIYITSIIYGFTSVASTLLNICIMLEFGTNLGFGALSSVLAVISIITAILLGKFTKAGKRSVLMYILAVIPIVGSVVFVVYPCLVTIIIYNVLAAITHISYSVIFDHHRNSNLKEFGHYEDIAEHQDAVEKFLQISRILSYGLLLLISIAHSYILFKISLIIFTLSYSAITLALMVYEKKFFKDLKKDDANVDNK